MFSNNQNQDPANEMNLTRHSRQLFPLILGNSSARPISTSKVQFTKEELDIKLNENPYYAKYAEKIQKLKESNPEEYSKRIEAIKKLAEKPKSSKTSQKDSEDAKPAVKKHSGAETTTKKGLDSIMKVELLNDKLPTEITELWKSYYKEKDAVYAVIAADLYKEVAVRRKANPIFIYPLPRKDGYEMFLGQFSEDDCHFTSLTQYQKHQENAPVQLVINHYTDLIESKGLVLMSGRPMDESLDVMDAQLLAYQMQYFYNEENYRIVEEFSKTPNNFDFRKIIDCVGKQLLEQQRKT